MATDTSALDQISSQLDVAVILLGIVAFLLFLIFLFMVSVHLGRKENKDA